MNARVLVAALLETDEVDPESYLDRLDHTQSCPRCQGTKTKRVRYGVGRYNGKQIEYWACSDCGDKFMWSDDRQTGVKFESEEEVDPDFSMDYVEKAGEPWYQFNLITTREWRALLTSLGYRVTSLYRHRATGKRRYGHMSITVKPKDGHLVDEQDAALLADYMYDLLAKRFGKKWYESDALIDANAYSAGTWSAQHTPPSDWQERMKKLNQIDIFIHPPDEHATYAASHPLAGWPTVVRPGA